MYHVNTCNKEELKQLNIIASNVGVSVKNIIKFMNAFGDNNTRYQLIWGWLHDPCVKLSFRGFKGFLHNIKIRNIDDWCMNNGKKLFKEDKFYIEDYMEV